MGIIQADEEFLKGLRQLCDEYHIVLIFDEVITGFRVDYHSCPKFLGVVPDMVCFGKIIGGGLPVGAYGGKKEIMELVSPSGPIYQAGTLSGNPLAMRVGYAQLTYLKDHPEVYQHITSSAQYLAKGIEKILNELHLPFQVHQVGSLLTLFFTAQDVHQYTDVQTCDTHLYTIFFKEMLKQGILIAPSQFEAWFISDSHTKQDLDDTLIAIHQALVKVYDAMAD